MKTDNSFFTYLFKRKRLSLSLGFLVLFVISAISWMKIPLEVMPKESIEPFLYIQVRPTRPSTVEVNEVNLTIPVENALRTVSGIKSIEATTSSGQINLNLNFKAKTNMDLAVFNIQEGLQELEDLKILDMKNVKIMRFNPQADAIIKLSVEIPVEFESPFRFVQDKLKKFLESTPGIAKMEVTGIGPLEQEFKIPLDKVQEHKISGANLSENFNFENSRVGLGSIASVSKNRKIGLRATNITKSLRAVRSTRVKKGLNLNLGNISKEATYRKSQKNISRKNGLQSIFIEIYQNPKIPIFNFQENVANRIQEFYKESKKNEKVKIKFLINKARDLKKAISDVFNSLYLAVGITFLVVLVFLREVFPTLIISIIIPLSLLLVVSVLYFGGNSLNLLTLSGLILSIGLIVDNSIVMVEKIQELRKKGLSKVECAGQSAKDMAIPLLLSTLTTIIIFLPAAFIGEGDSFSKMLKAFQVPVISGLLASYILALFFVPLLTFLERDQKKKKEMVKKEEVGFSFFYLIQHNKLLVASSIIFFLFILYQNLSIEETDIEDPKPAYVNLTLNFTQEIIPKTRKEFFDKVESKLIQKKEKMGVSQILSDFPLQGLSATFSLFPIVKSKRQELQKEIALFVKSEKKKPGVSFELEDSSFLGDFVEDKQEIQFEGPNSKILAKVLQDLKKQILELENIDKVNTQKEERGEKSYYLFPNQDLIKSFDLTLDSISSQISSFMRSVQIDGLLVAGKRAETAIKIVPVSGQWDLESFKNLKIEISPGKFIAASSLGKIREARISESIRRKNGVTELGLFVYFRKGLEEEKIFELKEEVNYVISSFEYPKGIGQKKDDFFARIEEIQKRSQFVIFLSVFLIYLLLASLFESPILPFSILFTVPLAIIFGLFGLKYFGFKLDPMARLGLIILIGIVVNNAIILIDVILKLRKSGKKRVDAIAIGCTQRLKAVFMTSATTVFGLFPVAFGQAKIMGIPYSSLGVCLISGMSFSTLITLILLPIIYLFFDSIEGQLKSFLMRFNESGT